jgi:PucR C-terminal helix-turn-helix domain
MSESTRPQGVPESGDGGSGGGRVPVPPPSPAGSPGTLFDALLHEREARCVARLAWQRRNEVRVPHGVLLLFGPDTDAPALARRVAGLIPRAAAVPGGTPPRHAAVVVPAPGPASWRHSVRVAREEAAARDGLLLARAPVLGLRALRAAYFRAVADAALAVALDVDGPLVTARELLVPRMLAGLDIEGQATLLEPLQPVLGLPGPQRRIYIRTLDALRRQGCTQATAAAALHIHTNTLRYRLDRIEDLTGLHLDIPGERMLLDLAALLVLLRGDPPDDTDDFGLRFMEFPKPPRTRAAPPTDAVALRAA